MTIICEKPPFFLILLHSYTHTCTEHAYEHIHAQRRNSIDSLRRFFFSSHTFYFPASADKPWSQVSPLLPPGSCHHFLSRIWVGFSNPTARRVFIKWCQPTLSRLPQVNSCARKSPTDLYEYALGGVRTHETDL